MPDFAISLFLSLNPILDSNIFISSDLTLTLAELEIVFSF
jgi:hypothetical protein